MNIYRGHSATLLLDGWLVSTTKLRYIGCIRNRAHSPHVAAITLNPEKRCLLRLKHRMMFGLAAN